MCWVSVGPWWLNKSVTRRTHRQIAHSRQVGAVEGHSRQIAGVAGSRIAGALVGRRAAPDWSLGGATAAQGVGRSHDDVSVSRRGSVRRRRVPTFAHCPIERASGAEDFAKLRAPPPPPTLTRR